MFINFLVDRLHHYEQFYGSREEFIEHLQSGEVTIPAADVMKYVEEYEQIIKQGIFNVGDKVYISFSKRERFTANVLGVHFYRNKVKYDLEIKIYDEPPTRIYNVDSDLVEPYKPAEINSPLCPPSQGIYVDAQTGTITCTNPTASSGATPITFTDRDADQHLAGDSKPIMPVVAGPGLISVEQPDGTKMLAVESEYKKKVEEDELAVKKAIESDCEVGINLGDGKKTLPYSEAVKELEKMYGPEAEKETDDARDFLQKIQKRKQEAVNQVRAEKWGKADAKPEATQHSEEHEWISTHKQRPFVKPGHNVVFVLAVTKGSLFPEKLYFHSEAADMEKLWFDPIMKKWIDNHQVTHWMPLPVMPTYKERYCY